MASKVKRVVNSVNRIRQSFFKHDSKNLHDEFAKKINIKSPCMFGIDKTDEDDHESYLKQKFNEKLHTKDKLEIKIKKILEALDICDLQHIYDVLYNKQFVLRDMACSQKKKPPTDVETLITEITKNLLIFDWNKDETIQQRAYINYYSLKSLYYLNKRAYMAISNIIFNIYWFRQYYDSSDMVIYYSPLIIIYTFGFFYAKNYKEPLKFNKTFTSFIQNLFYLVPSNKTTFETLKNSLWTAITIGTYVPTRYDDSSKLRHNFQNLIPIYKDLNEIDFNDNKTIIDFNIKAYNHIGFLKKHFRTLHDVKFATSVVHKQLCTLLSVSCDIVKSLLALDIIERINPNLSKLLVNCLPAEFNLDIFNYTNCNSKTIGYCTVSKNSNKDETRANADTCDISTDRLEYMFISIGEAKKKILKCISHINNHSFRIELCNRAFDILIPFYVYSPFNNIYDDNNKAWIEINNTIWKLLKENRFLSQLKHNSNSKPLEFDDIIKYIMKDLSDKLDPRETDFKKIMAIAATRILCPTITNKMIDNTQKKIENTKRYDGGNKKHTQKSGYNRKKQSKSQ